MLNLFFMLITFKMHFKFLKYFLSLFFPGCYLARSSIFVLNFLSYISCVCIGMIIVLELLVHGNPRQCLAWKGWSIQEKKIYRFFFFLCCFFQNEYCMSFFYKLLFTHFFFSFLYCFGLLFLRWKKNYLFSPGREKSPEMFPHIGPRFDRRGRYFFIPDESIIFCL